MIASTALVCMALVVYHEARSEMVPAQYAVAQVLLRRAEGEPRKVCAETFRHKQFSWANTGVRRVKGGWSLSARLTPREIDAWKKALRIAQVTLNWKNVGDFSRGATHFYSLPARPYWRASMVRTHRLGAFIFLREA